MLLSNLFGNATPCKAQIYMGFYNYMRINLGAKGLRCSNVLLHEGPFLKVFVGNLQQIESIKLQTE